MFIGAEWAQCEEMEEGNGGEVQKFQFGLKPSHVVYQALEIGGAMRF